jgi:hypothetical protein
MQQQTSDIWSDRDQGDEDFNSHSGSDLEHRDDHQQHLDENKKDDYCQNGK